MAELEKQEIIVDNGSCFEEEKLVKMMDFDMLCSGVTMQTNYGKWGELNVGESEDDDIEHGGLLRMWEGGVLDCFDDQSVALQSACCPCFRFGTNMRRAGFGSCFTQGLVYMILFLTALLNILAYIITNRHCFLYMGAAFLIFLGSYMGFYRSQIRKKFNIMNSDTLDDCVYHIICPCCTLSQESRTLEMNNVQDGIWNGRGDTICIGSYNENNKVFLDQLTPPPVFMSTKSNKIHSMQKSMNISSSHSWNFEDGGDSDPLVTHITLE